MVQQLRRVAGDARWDDERLSLVFSALGDPIRRDIVARLADRDETLTELAAPYGITVQAVAKHLRVLTDAGLVTRPADTYRKPVHLEAEVFDLMTKWIERYRRQAEERYRRLDDVLAAMPDEPHRPPVTATKATTATTATAARTATTSRTEPGAPS